MDTDEPTGSTDAGAGAAGRRLLSATARGSESSAIRDLLQHARRPDVISLAGGIPAPELFPLARIREAVDTSLDRLGPVAVQYGLTAGEAETRELAARLTGAGTTPEEVVITTGSQQALDLLARVLLDPGDTVVTSDPDYLGALQALRTRSPRFEPVALDSDGMRTDLLEERLEAGMTPKLCYVVSNFHNPTGASLSAERRHHLSDLAAHYGFLVIEDDPYGDLWFGDGPNEPIGPDNPMVIRLRSISKIVAPGLRIGWMTGPKWLREAIEVAKQSADLHTSTFSQAVMVATISNPAWFDAHLDQVRAHYRAQRDAMVAALESHLGDRISYQIPQGGMFLWAHTNHAATDVNALLPKALEAGVAFVPGAAFAVSSPATNALRLSYATVPPAQLDDAAARLATVLP